MEDWLYDEGEDETKSVYVAKLAELRAKGDPIAARAAEDETRPGAWGAGRALALLDATAVLVAGSPEGVRHEKLAEHAACMLCNYRCSSDRSCTDVVRLDCCAVTLPAVIFALRSRHLTWTEASRGVGWCCWQKKMFQTKLG
jgi:predicted NBD/HSP70 family sugar kinase